MTNEPVDILLVEDNPNDVELTLLALRENNLANNICVARDGAEALDFIFCKGQHADRDIHNGPRVILLDLKLPKVDGIEVLRQMKADDLTKRYPVVMLTSSREESDIVATYDLGVNSYIVKPVDWGKFADAIKSIGLYWLVINERPVV